MFTVFVNVMLITFFQRHIFHYGFDAIISARFGGVAFRYQNDFTFLIIGKVMRLALGKACKTMLSI